MKHSVRILAALLGLLVLASCGAAPAPADTAESAEAAAPAAAVGESVSEEAAAFPLVVRDDLSREVTLSAPPERVAVLIGSFAETWLLAGGDLVAAPKDAWEDFALDLDESVVNLGSYQKVSAEALFDLEADLVIASANTKAHGSAPAYSDAGTGAGDRHVPSLQPPQRRAFLYI